MLARLCFLDFAVDFAEEEVAVKYAESSSY